jgi:hypothetical protein
MVASVAVDSDPDMDVPESWGVVVAEDEQAVRKMEINIKP